MPGCSPGTGRRLRAGATTPGDMWALWIPQVSELRARRLLSAEHLDLNGLRNVLRFS